MMWKRLDCGMLEVEGKDTEGRKKEEGKENGSVEREAGWKSGRREVERSDVEWKAFQ